MAPKVYPQYTRVLYTPTVYEKGTFGPKKWAKTHSERLQNDFQGLNFPLLSPQNGPKLPQMAPKGYPEYTRVIFWVIAQYLGPLGPLLMQKRGEISSKMSPIWSHPRACVRGPGGQGH